MKTEKVVTIVAAVFIIVLFGILSFKGAESTKQKEAEKKDLEGYRKKVDAIFKDMADDVMKYTKQTETEDSTGEFLAMAQVNSSLDEGQDALLKVETPDEYEEQEAEVMSRLEDAIKTCSDVIGLYTEEKNEEAYNKIQDVIDKFAEALKEKNEMFGYE
ncbi:hypothetical protein [Melghirimyces algeriensis]|uniref:Uncharacterized protein n=1 Tax=Melghirimyces algeriensis TaxID=910412 RepID=A0A521FA07_9BACL|nr:hypothetical protein [Melghirimyces algeriensis]SMO92874.1 hypothetical protein SAMN06264849_1158 [Melghirimyces algeriensis]